MSHLNGKTHLKRQPESDLRWGKALRRALNELIRCRDEAYRQHRRIDKILREARSAFDEMKRKDELEQVKIGN